MTCQCFLRVTFLRSQQAPQLPAANSVCGKAAASRWPRDSRPTPMFSEALALKQTGTCPVLAAGPPRQATTMTRTSQASACPAHGRNVTTSIRDRPGWGFHWVGEHPLVFLAKLTVRVKITPATSFSKIKHDAIANVCRCIQTQMGTSVFNCK